MNGAGILVKLFPISSPFIPDDRPYKCDCCTKAFKHATSLRNHRAGIHSKERHSFQCSLCGTLFTLLGNLKAHMKRNKCSKLQQYDTSDNCKTTLTSHSNEINIGLQPKIDKDTLKQFSPSFECTNNPVSNLKNSEQIIEPITIKPRDMISVTAMLPSVVNPNEQQSQVIYAFTAPNITNDNSENNSLSTKLQMPSNTLLLNADDFILTKCQN